MTVLPPRTILYGAPAVSGTNVSKTAMKAWMDWVTARINDGSVPVDEVSAIITSDWQPETADQVTALRAFLDEIEAFCASYERPILELRHCGDIVDRPRNNDGTLPLYSYPDLITDYSSRVLPPMRTIPGNHDLPFGDGEHPTNWTTIDYRQTFGAEFYAVRRGTLIQIYLGDMAGGTHGEQNEAALVWFEGVLANAGNNNVEIYIHQPIWGTRGASVATHTSSGFPADPLTQGVGYQYYSERLAEAIAACPNVAFVAYGHIGGDYDGSTEVVEKFGTTHIGFQLALENTDREENGGAVEDWPNHYAVIDYTNGSTDVLIRRRDAKTGDWITGSDIELEYAFPVNLRGPVFDGQQALSRIDPVAHGALVVTQDMSDQRSGTTPSIEAVPGVRWMFQSRLTEISLDNPAAGDGSGILLGIPGSATAYSSGGDSGDTAGELLATLAGGGWGGGIAATRDGGSDGSLIGRMTFLVQTDAAGGTATLAEFMRVEGDEMTVEFVRGIKPVALTSSDDLDDIGAALTGRGFIFAEYGQSDLPANRPFTYGSVFFSQSSDGSMGEFATQRSGAGEMAYRNFTSAAWTSWRAIHAMGTNSAVTVTDATATITAGQKDVTANRAGTVTLTLPAASDLPGRMLHVRTLQAQAVVSAGSNIVPGDSATAGTAILPAVRGAWAWLYADGTNWKVLACSHPVTITDPRARPGVPVRIAGGNTDVTHTGTTGEVTLATFTLPAGYKGRNGRLRIGGLMAFTADASSETLRIKIGATNILSVTSVIGSNASVSFDTWLVNRDSETAQIGAGSTATSNLEGSGVSSVANSTYTFDTTTDLTVTITAQLGDAADTATLSAWWAEVTHVA